MGARGANAHIDLPPNLGVGPGKVHWHLCGRESGNLEVHVSKIRYNNNETWTCRIELKFRVFSPAYPELLRWEE